VTEEQLQLMPRHGSMRYLERGQKKSLPQDLFFHKADRKIRQKRHHTVQGAVQQSETTSEGTVCCRYEAGIILKMLVKKYAFLKRRKQLKCFFLLEWHLYESQHCEENMDLSVVHYFSAML